MDKWMDTGHVDTERMIWLAQGTVLSLQITSMFQGTRNSFSALIFHFWFFEIHSRGAYVALNFSVAKTDLEFLIPLPPFPEYWNKSLSLCPAAFLL